MTHEELVEVAARAADTSYERMVNAFEALRAQGVALVPAEPTEEMWTAGRRPLLIRDANGPAKYVTEAPWFRADKDNPPRTEPSFHAPKGDWAVWIYRAMLAAGEIRPKEGT